MSPYETIHETRKAWPSNVMSRDRASSSTDISNS